MFKVAPIFSSNMVLQREKNIKVWGTGDEDTFVTVSIENNKVIGKVKNGKWSVILPSMQAGGPYELKVTDENATIIFHNVMLGEVWLAGGQSNMELRITESKNGEELLANIKNDKVRYYNTLRLSYIDEEFLEKEAINHWQECSSETAGEWSAVAYYFAKKMSEELGVTVGIIGCNWGGTSASAWMSRESLEEDKDTNTYVQEYEECNKGRSFEEYLEQLTEYNTWYEAWQKRVDKCYAENPDILWPQVLEIAGESRWPEPLGPKSPFRAAGLYETMLKRVMPYTLRGFIYYQGESDDHKPKIYEKLLTKLILQWRKDWEDEELPFIFVQLPMHIWQQDKDIKHWAIIREAQMSVHKTIKNTGMAVVLDCGEFDNIHPVDKEPVGIRLALQALYHVHGKKLAAYGPIYKGLEYKENGVELSFTHAEDGIVLKGEAAEGFEVAGEDKQFMKAKAEIRKDKIYVYCKKVKEPKYVRYNWTNYGPVTLFGKNGIPLAPFRTSRNDE